MFRKLSLALLLFASFGFAQVATVGGTATTAGPAVATVPVSAANVPLISTPDIALPGSGPAMGAPISAAAANDSRSSSGPSVYNPNGMRVSEPAATNLATIPSASTPAAAVPATPASTAPASVTTMATPATTEPFENGIQHFESGMPNTSNPTQSLAQIARAYRAQHRQAAKTFNNDSIAQLNARGVRTGNLGPETSTVVASSQPAAQPAQPANAGTLMAQNQPPALPQSDQYQSAPSATSPAASSSTAWQQRHKTAEQNTPTAAQSANESPQQASTPQSAPAANPSNTKKQSAALPQTGSPLPLLLLLGGLGVVGGVVYWLRR